MAIGAYITQGEIFNPDRKYLKSRLIRSEVIRIYGSGVDTTVI